MTNPFDDLDSTFRVLVNESGQHSLWPGFAEVPGGWVAVHGPTTREECLEYVTEHWRDITPIGTRDRAAS